MEKDQSPLVAATYAALGFLGVLVLAVCLGAVLYWWPM